MKKINLYTVILFLMCLGSFLNLFVPRFAEDQNYFLRLPVQIVGGLTFLSMMFIVIPYKASAFNSISKLLFALISIVFVYSIAAYFDGDVIITKLIPSLRLVTWLSGTIFFMSLFKSYSSPKLIKTFLIVFIIVAAEKIFQSSLYTSQKLDEGDIAGLTLVIAIPAILIFFNKRTSLILLIIVAMLILFSLRRTAIIALLLSAPFILRELKAKLKFIYIILFVLVSFVAIYYTWDKIGVKIATRFQELSTGSSSGVSKNNSYGSGRSEFYGIVFESYIHGNPIQIIFGNGIGSVGAILKAKYADIGHVHNDFLEILYTFGLLGISVWLLFIYQLLRLIKYVKLYSKDLINIYYITLISFFTVSFTSGTLFKIEMLVFALTISYIIIIVERKREYLVKFNKY